MTLQTSGPISINDLKSEFNSTANDLLSYYRGGGIVDDIAANSGVPTSGAISLTDFYGADGNLGDVTPDNTWFNDPSGEDTIYTNTVTITGLDIAINLYYTISGDTPILAYKKNAAGYVGWSSGSPGTNTISVAASDTLTLEFTAFSNSSGSINIYNDTDNDTLLDTVSWSITVGK